LLLLIHWFKVTGKGQDHMRGQRHLSLDDKIWTCLLRKSWDQYQSVIYKSWAQ